MTMLMWEQNLRFVYHNLENNKRVSMNFIEWNDETMGIGIELIDTQHKELLRIINKLSLSITSNSQRQDILDIVNELVNYAQFHFNTEEELFDKLNYENSVEHKAEHVLFMEKFIALKDKITQDISYVNKSAVEISEEVFHYILNWFLNHIVGSDKKFVKLFKENNL